MQEITIKKIIMRSKNLTLVYLPFNLILLTAVKMQQSGDRQLCKAFVSMVRIPANAMVKVKLNFKK